MNRLEKENKRFKTTTDWLMAHPHAPSRTAHAEHKIGRNEKCPCGSGLKFKNCCIDRGEGLKRKYHRVSRKEKNNAVANSK